MDAFCLHVWSAKPRIPLTGPPWLTTSLHGAVQEVRDLWSKSVTNAALTATLQFIQGKSCMDAANTRPNIYFQIVTFILKCVTVITASTNEHTNEVLLLS